MCLKVLETLLIYVIVYAVGFEDIFVTGQEADQMMDKGRTQYQLLRAKSTLPRYGPCWLGAIEHVEDGCRGLSEDSQSDMALHLTNCFLEMSGHPTYNCELDKKPNLRGICISSMSDRAFNVYTEFYTHVQHICWFLRGQIWHETISENSFKLGRQLEASARNQEELLHAQRESLDVQRKILQHERFLERVLEDLYISTKAHQEILKVLTRSVASFQSWVIGEVSWFDSLVFYIILTVFAFVFTSVRRTASARLPLLLMLFLNMTLERIICSVLISDDSVLDTKSLYENIYTYIWYCRYLFILITLAYLFHHSYHYRDLAVENHKFLLSIQGQNTKILDMLGDLDKSVRHDSVKGDSFSLINEALGSNGFSFKRKDCDLDESNSSVFSTESVRGRRTYSSRPHLHVHDLQNGKYNLRSSKQNTPDLN